MMDCAEAQCLAACAEIAQILKTLQRSHGKTDKADVAPNGPFASTKSSASFSPACCSLATSESQTTVFCTSRKELCTPGCPKPLPLRTLPLPAPGRKAHQLSAVLQLARWKDSAGLVGERTQMFPRCSRPEGLALLLRVRHVTKSRVKKRVGTKSWHIPRVASSLSRGASSLRTILGPSQQVLSWQSSSSAPSPCFYPEHVTGCLSLSRLCSLSLWGRDLKW